MHLFVAGATGVLGRALVREALAAGHTVSAPSRDRSSDARLDALGARPVRADLFDARSLTGAARGAEAVVRVATRIPAAPRSIADWAENDRLRREGTANLIAAARASGARYVQESVVWLARPDDGSAFDEAAAVNPDAVTASAADAERLAREAVDVSTATLRLGWLYGSDAPSTVAFAGALRERRMPVFGQAPLSFLHVVDAGRALLAAAAARATGTFHVVDDRPTRLDAFLDAFARGLGAPLPERIPTEAARAAIGEEAVRFLATPCVTNASRFKDAFAWRPRFESVDDGLVEVLAGLVPPPRAPQGI